MIITRSYFFIDICILETCRFLLLKVLFMKIKFRLKLFILDTCISFMDDQTIINYLLDKQSLISKKPANQLSNLIHQQLGLHSTDYLTPYISLWNRIDDFDPKQLFMALNKLDFLRKRAYRGTVFVIAKDILPILNVSSKVFATTWFKGFEKELVKMNIDFAPFTKHIKELFEKHKELTVNELKKLIEGTNLFPSKLCSLALRYYELDGFLVRTTHRYLNDRVIRYGLVEQFFPKISKNPLDVDTAFEDLFLRYLKQYGPVTVDDFSWWLPTTKTKSKQLIEKYKEEISEIKFNNQTYFIHNTDYNMLQKYEHKVDLKVNFLPYEDHFPKSYTKRQWYLADELQTTMIGQTTMTAGQLWPSIWVNGKIIGKWEIVYQDKAKTSTKIKITHLENRSKLEQTILDEIENQRNNLEYFINEKLLPLNQKKK
ncbi:MAG: winged helix DNA-binding domain-containing protein [Asgard group archaeon]|nr:winged helix DNA-binding domain-containing protein [Asgard group archaeon]